MDSHFRNNVMMVGSLKAKIVPMKFYIDKDVKEAYNEIKANPKYKKADLVFLDSKLVFGCEHIAGIMKILSERKKRNIVSYIKNIEIEFLLRVCCTDQINEALKVNFGDKSNKDFVIIIITDDDHIFEEIERDFAIYGNLDYENVSQTEIKDLIAADTYKRDYIIEKIFREKIKHKNSTVLNSNDEFLKFLVERAAISLA
jgi:tRNA threonylcarbamoyladenosine modification (KEOPS) complex Cgi121 subunit